MRRHLLLGLLAVGLVAGMAERSAGQAVDYYTATFPASADGSMCTQSDGGYAINMAGPCIAAQAGDHFTFLGFGARSDGRDRVPFGAPGDTGDGSLLSAYMMGKRVMAATLYVRDATHQVCGEPGAAQGQYLNDPIVVMGFRAANEGPFVDRSGGGTIVSNDSECADYASPALQGGENSAVAWRMGPPPYSGKGDAGQGCEYYIVSNYDTMNAGETVAAVPGGVFADGLGGWGETAGRFAFQWLVQNSDAHLVNSQSLDWNDCTPLFGGEEVRDYAGDGTAGTGWYAVPLDRWFVDALANDPETKGIVLNSLDAPMIIPGQPWDTKIYTHDQADGSASPYGPYIRLTCTIQGDLDGDGCVNVFDIFVIAEHWGPIVFQPDIWEPVGPDIADLDGDGSVNIFDIFVLAEYWNQCITDGGEG